MVTGLVLGLDGTGKTLLLRQLTAQVMSKQKTVLQRFVAFASSLYSNEKEDEYTDAQCIVDSDTQPSVGVEHWSLKLVNAKNCMLREIGGQLLPMWPLYFDSCHFWLFLVDASNPTQLAAAAIEFYAILSVDEMRHKAKLVVITHIDANFVVTDAMLQTYLCLNRLVADADNGPVQVIKVSALTGENVAQIIKWLEQASKEHFRNSNTIVNNNRRRVFSGIRRSGLEPNGIRVYPVTN